MSWSKLLRAFTLPRCKYCMWKPHTWYTPHTSHNFDVCGSVHHGTIHKEKSNKMQQCIKIDYSLFIWSSTRFGRHTAHHQKPKTALAASGFSYVEGGWTLSGTSVPDNIHQPHIQQPSTYEKPGAASAVLGRLLMMGGVARNTLCFI